MGPNEPTGTIETWLADTQAALVSIRSAGWEEFANSYEHVTRAAMSELGLMSARLSALVENADHISQADFLFGYIEAMSVAVDGKSVFLPSFSDECLWSVVKGDSFNLSPFRGLYYCWKISEIAYTMQRRGKVATGFRELEALMVDSLEPDQKRQYPSSTYDQYTSSLRNDNLAWSVKTEQVKRAIREVIVPRKWTWIQAWPYPCRTAAHFYLSGIRFYHNAHINGANAGVFHTEDRYCVNSRDSGLVVPSERYGILLPPGSDQDAANSLIADVPPGSLLLDLIQENATPEDLEKLPYYESWSRLVTAKMHAVSAEALSLRELGGRSRGRNRSTYTELARSQFLNAVGNNPMRTFYFDTGILGAAQLATRLGFPKVQYLTTRRTEVERGRTSPSRRLLDDLFARFGDGMEFYLTDGVDWPEQAMSTWSLSPSGRELSRRTSCLWSVRGTGNRKISCGVEGPKWHLYLSRSLSPRDLATEGVEALAGSTVGTAVLPGEILLGVITGALVGAGSSTLRVRREALRVSDSIANVRRNDSYTKIEDAAQFPIR